MSSAGLLDALTGFMSATLHTSGRALLQSQAGATPDVLVRCNQITLVVPHAIRWSPERAFSADTGGS